MSAWPDRPADFVDWAARRHGEVRATDFLPRQWYGEYVRESLLGTAEAVAETARLSIVFDEVRRVARHPAGGWMVHLGRHPSVRADGVVLAVGHRPPSDPIGPRWSGPRTRFIADPWRPFATHAVGPDDAVIVLGSGLTAVDTVLSLSQSERRAAITLVSRHGLLPHAHAAAPVSPVDLSGWVSELTASAGGVRINSLARGLRHRARELTAAGGDWRALVDGLRPHAPLLWRAMAPGERRRFLERLRPFWEVHRHRMARPVAEQVSALRAQGRLGVVAGRVAEAVATEDAVKLTVRARGTDRLTELDASWVINCTGPLPSNSVEANPVVGSLLVSGLLRPDELLLGVETTPDGEAVAAGGRTVEDLFVVGTLRKPADWESTAVPELRHQAAAVAEKLVGRLAAGRRIPANDSTVRKAA
jgi:uncharacterized NAD(P)/FAD-binding protein YdhS